MAKDRMGNLPSSIPKVIHLYDHCSALPIQDFRDDLSQGQIHVFVQNWMGLGFACIAHLEFALQHSLILYIIENSLEIHHADGQTNIWIIVRIDVFS